MVRLFDVCNRPLLLTGNAGVLIISSKLRPELVAGRVNSVRIIDAEDLAGGEGDLAIKGKTGDRACVGAQKVLSNLNLAGDSNIIDIVSDNGNFHAIK